MTMRLEMVPIQIVGLKPLLNVTIGCLHRLGCVQLEKLSDLTNPPVRPLQLDADAIRDHEEHAHLLARIEGLLSLLGSNSHSSSTATAQYSEDCRAAAQAGAELLAPQVQALVARRDALKADQTSLPRYAATLSRLLPLLPPSAATPGNTSVAVLVSRSQLAVLDLVAQRVTQITGGRAAIVSGDVDAATRAMLLVLPRECLAEVQKLLGREDISRLQLPQEYAGQPLGVALSALRSRLAAIPAELAQVEASLAELADAWRPRLEHWRRSLRARLSEFAVLAGLGETQATFVLFGWVPARELARTEAALQSEVGQALVLQKLPLAELDVARVPVALANPPPARPFESLVRLLALPRYNGPDPTLLMSFGLPLFFGLILGDVGYGTLLLLISLLLLRRFRQPGTARDILRVLALGSVSGIVFGVLYGEAFGTLGVQWGMRPLWLDRADAEQLPALLLFTIALGAVHITLGLILGVWEAWRARSRGHLLERGGMLIGLIGLFWVVAALVRWIPGGLTPGVAVIVVGVVLLGASYGWIGCVIGPIEFVGVIGNILSYLRLAAIGLASLYLARVANDMAGQLGNVIVGAIVAVLIHALNLVMGAFSPTIHSLRLHYVEFFRKFYEGGGRPYTPFKLQP
jgi:V/A-type H+-transporting ATPase subunit I